jgi:hypothetical protein
MKWRKNLKKINGQLSMEAAPFGQPDTPWAKRKRKEKAGFTLHSSIFSSNSNFSKEAVRE